MADDYYGFEFFKTERRDNGVLWVWFNRPERRNAISVPMHEEIGPLFRRIGADRSVKVVVITGSGDKAFCVGADFQGMQSNIDGGGYDASFDGIMLGSAEIMKAHLAVPQPIIAAVNGDAIGLGATLAFFCDIVFMAEEARIADPHVKAGLVAGDGGCIIWPILLGPHKAKEFLFTGDLMTATEANRLGLVNRLVPRAELLAVADELASRIAKGPQAVIQFNKRLANFDIVERVTKLLDPSLAMEALSLVGPDHKEAVNAFLEKREPVFGSGGKAENAYG